MASTLSDSRRDLVLGAGAAVGGLLLGLALVGLVLTDSLEVLSGTLVVAVLVVGAFAYGIAGLYDIVALGIPKRGVGHLVTGAGIVLALLAPYGSSERLFVAAGAFAVLASGGYQLALVADLLSASEEPATELEGDGEAG